MKKFLIKFILFTCLTMTALWWVSDFFVHNLRRRGDTNNEAFYELEENSLDVVLVGSSHCYCGFDPTILRDEYGMDAYDLASPNQTILADYLYAKEAYRTQKYKVLVVDVNGFYTVADDDLYTHISSLYSMRPSPYYFEYAKYVRKKDAYKIVFPVFITHDEWKAINKGAFVSTVERESIEKRGFMGISSEAGDDAKTTIIGNQIVTEPTDFTFADKIRDFCNDNGIKLVFVKSIQAENDVNEWKDSKHNTIANYCDTNGIPFLDFNTDYYMEAAGLKIATDVAEDLRHASISGAQKETRYLGQFLKKYVQ